VDELRLVCPACRDPKQPNGAALLRLVEPFETSGQEVVEGLLECPARGCNARYPLVEGIPILARDLAGWRRAQGDAGGALGRSGEMQRFFGAAERAGGPRFERRWIGSYLQAHFDELETGAAPWRELLEVLETVELPDDAAALDAGCSVGRLALELGSRVGLSVGLELDWHRLLLAERMRTDSQVEHDVWNRGHRWTSRTFEFDGHGRSAFVLGDVLDPPFEAGRFDLVSAVNLLDSVRDPLLALGQLDALLAPGGILLICTPYCWDASICAPAHWLETEEVGPDRFVRELLQGERLPQTGFRYRLLVERDDLEWPVVHHERQRSVYRNHLLCARKPAMSA